MKECMMWFLEYFLGIVFLFYVVWQEFYSFVKFYFGSVLVGWGVLDRILFVGFIRMMWEL